MSLGGFRSLSELSFQIRFGIRGSSPSQVKLSDLPSSLEVLSLWNYNIAFIGNEVPCLSNVTALKVNKVTEFPPKLLPSLQHLEVRDSFPQELVPSLKSILSLEIKIKKKDISLSDLPLL